MKFNQLKFYNWPSSGKELYSYDVPPLQVSGPLNAGAPLNAISSFHGLNPLLRMQEQFVLISNTGLSVGDVEQLNISVSFILSKNIDNWFFWFFDKIYETTGSSAQV